MFWTTSLSKNEPLCPRVWRKAFASCLQTCFAFFALFCDSWCSRGQPRQNRTKSELTHSVQTAQPYFLSDLSSPSLHILGKDKGEKQGWYTKGCTRAAAPWEGRGRGSCQSWSHRATRWQTPPVAGAPALPAGCLLSCSRPPVSNLPCQPGKLPCCRSFQEWKLNDAKEVLNDGG